MKKDELKEFQSHFSNYGFGDEMLELMYGFFQELVMSGNDNYMLSETANTFFKKLQSMMDKRVVKATENAKEETLKNCEHDIKVLEVKARLAANIFNTLSVHLKLDALSSYTLDKLQCDTINTTNRIFNKIQ